MQDGTWVGGVDVLSTESHSTRLYSALEFLFSQFQTRLDAVDCFAVTTGPGSFAGLRIGVAAMKGLAELAGKPTVGISTLEAIAASAPPRTSEGRLVALMDARRSELFAGVYALSGENLKCIEPDRLFGIEEFFSSQPQEPTLFVGPEVEKFQLHIQEKSKIGWALEKTTAFLAPAAARLAWKKFNANEVTSADALSVQYLRRSDAELMFKEKLLPRG